MKSSIVRLTAVIALYATTACTAERSLGPAAPSSSVASASALTLPQVPLLYVVDGVRLQRDQVPNLSGDQVSQVRVLKGRAALREFGPDASYGVVVITTRQAAPRS